MLVLCDDLTGAGAYAGEMADLGVSARVLLVAEVSTAPVTIVDLETRDLEPEAAAVRTRDAIEQLLGRESRVLLARRVDTSLRGPIAAEIQVALDAAGLDRLVLAPAYPSAGRTTVAGRQHLPDGTALDVVSLVPRQLRPVVGGVQPPGAGECWIPDVETHDDVARAAQVMANLGPGVTRLLLADAGPVGAALARRVLVARAHRILVVVGSSTDLMSRQLARLRCLPNQDVDVIAAPLAGPADPGFAALVDHASRELLTGAFAAVVLSGGLTAGAILRSIGSRPLEPIGMAAPLISLLRAEGPFGSLLVALKGGHVGGDDALIATVDRLRTALSC